MLAIKAKYENGIVRWLENPPVSGKHDLIVLFEDMAEGHPQGGPSTKAENTRMGEEALKPLPELSGSVPDGWREAIYGG
jgi:hypothetical protein